MWRYGIIALLFLLSSFGTITAAEPSQEVGSIPLYFEANQGQFADGTHFAARIQDLNLFLMDRSIVLVDHETILNLTLSDSQSSPPIIGMQPQPGISNYFIGETTITNVPHYRQVRYVEVYPGIDIVFYGDHTALRYDFIIAPGADPSQIRLHFDPVQDTTLADNGNLVLHLENGILIQQAPFTYQEIEGHRREIASRFELYPNGQIGFVVDHYDTSLPLIIDPELIYSTYLGGTNEDRAYGIAVDTEGNTYVVGSTTSPDFPTHKDFLNGSRDVFVTKLNAAGDDLVYSTYIGGNSFDYGYDIILDANNNVVIVGETGSNDFPTTAGAYGEVFGGLRDAFVLKLNAAGNGLIYSTFLGHTSTDRAEALTLDDADNAYVVGQSYSANFPITAGAYDDTLAGTSDIFITKLNATGTDLVYSTFLGSESGEYAWDIALDPATNAYLIGRAAGADFPTTPGAFDQSHNGQNDVFVTKLNASGTDLVYSTFLGTAGLDYGYAIAVDHFGHAYITGGTSSDDFPLPNGFDQTYNGGIRDMFVAKLNPAGSQVMYGTLMGGLIVDLGQDIAIDALGQTYITGYSDGQGFYTTPNAFDSTFNGHSDAVMIVFNTDGSRPIYSSYLGGDDEEHGSALALDADLNAYIAGWTDSPNYYTTPGTYDGDHNGDFDAIIAQFNLQSTPDTLALVNTQFNYIGLVDTLEDWPPYPDSYNIYVAGTGILGQWVMGDWDGDGQTTPGVFTNGAFFYSNDIGTTPPEEWASIWLGPTEGYPVAGRFTAADNDCIGLVVDNLGLWWTCEMVNNPPPMGGQWLGGQLADKPGDYQFVAGDWDGDGIDTIAIRRDVYITWTNVPVTTVMSEFTRAQYIGQPSDQDYGILVAGDWDNDGADSFGLFYQDGSFYRRHDLQWNTGEYFLQHVGRPVGDSNIHALTWRDNQPTPPTIASSTTEQPQMASLQLIESDDPRVQHVGTWNAVEAANASGNRYLYTTDGELILDFEGTSVEVIYARHSDRGRFTIFVDGMALRTISATGEQAFGLHTSIDYLEPGPHTLRIQPIDGVVAIDAFYTTVLE